MSVYQSRLLTGQSPRALSLALRCLFDRHRAGSSTAAGVLNVRASLRISNDYFIIGPTDDNDVLITFSFARPQKHKSIKLLEHPNCTSEIKVEVIESIATFKKKIYLKCRHVTRIF